MVTDSWVLAVLFGAAKVLHALACLVRAARSRPEPGRHHGRGVTGTLSDRKVSRGRHARRERR